MQCIEKILESRTYFDQESEIGYYSLYEDLTKIHYKAAKADFVAQLDIESRLVFSRIRKIEAYLWHDLISEGQELMIKAEPIILEDLEDVLEPYIFEDPEYAGLIKEFSEKQREIVRLFDPCHECIRSWHMSKTLPFYEQDLEYPLSPDPYEVFQILEQQDQEKFTGTKGMIFDKAKRRIESDSEENRIKSALKGGFSRLAKSQVTDTN